GLSSADPRDQPPGSTTGINHRDQPPGSTTGINHRDQPPGSTTGINHRDQPSSRARSAVVSAGTSSIASAAAPKLAIWKIGALGSLLIATTVPARCIPTTWLGAPRIPTAM